MFFYKSLLLVFVIIHLSEVIGAANPNKTCILRESAYYQVVWKEYSGFYCYNFTNNYRLNFKYGNLKLKPSKDYPNLKVPVTQLTETSYFWYDFENTTSQYYLRKSFKNEDFFQMWISCAREAVDCCYNFMNEINTRPSEEYPCTAIWDGWSCFPPAKFGSTSKMPCSTQAYSTTSDVCVLNSEKYCLPNGTWNQQTNYEVCAIAPVLRHRHKFNIIFLSIGIGLSLPAVIIFFSFREFRSKTRIILHRNLIAIIIIRNVMTILSKQLLILDALKTTGSNHAMEQNSVACRVLAFFENASKNGMYASMLADGFYLHKIIVRAFAPEPALKWIYAAVFVLTFLPSLIWAIARGVGDGQQCWMVDNGQDQWISDGFRITILVINTCLLIDIIRVMVLKLKRQSASQQTKATFRATVFLIPLFGLHIAVITNRNILGQNATCTKEDIYYYVSYIMEGIQGVMVAMLFCYFNSEVKEELKNGFRKFVLHLEQRYGINIRRETIFGRRTTTATYIDPNSRRDTYREQQLRLGSLQSNQNKNFEKESEI